MVLSSALLAQAGLAAGGTALGAIPDIIPSKYEREQKKRLLDLKRQQELGALGLNQSEMRSLTDQFSGRSLQSEAYADAERQRLVGSDVQFGQDLLQEQISSEAAQRRQSDISSQLAMLNLQRKAEQEQEITDLEAAQAQYKRTRNEALLSPLQAGTEALAGGLALDKILGSANKAIPIESILKLPKEQASPFLQRQYNLTPDQASRFLKNAQPNLISSNFDFSAIGGSNGY